MGVEWTMWSGLCLISASVYQKSREQLLVGRQGNSSLGASVLVLPLWKSSKLHCWPSIVLSFSSGDQLLCIKVQHMFTLICMWHLCISVIHQTITWTTGSLTCLMQAYTHVFCTPLVVRVRKQRIVKRIYEMKYSSKGHKGKNIYKNRIKMSGQARLVYVEDANHNIPTKWRWARRGSWQSDVELFNMHASSSRDLVRFLVMGICILFSSESVYL